MRETTNLHLEIYEPTDNANLEDGYNASMRKIDLRDGEISTLITALNTTVTSFDGRITQAQTDASNASSLATTAAADASQALALAEGLEVHRITKEGFGTDWTIAADANIDTTKRFALEGEILFDPATGKGFALVHYDWYLRDTIPSPIQAFVHRQLFTLTNWTLDTSVETSRVYGWAGPWVGDGMMSDITDESIGWTTSTTVQNSYSGSNAFFGMAMFRVTRVS